MAGGLNGPVRECMCQFSIYSGVDTACIVAIADEIAINAGFQEVEIAAGAYRELEQVFWKVVKAAFNATGGQPATLLLSNPSCVT